MEEYYSVESCRRLMDLLAGWAELAESNEFAENEFDSIINLYQASQFCETDTDVKNFVKNKIVPLLISGRP